jgi:hypothetical protein
MTKSQIERKMVTMTAVADRYARMMGGRFVPDPERMEWVRRAWAAK